MAVRQPGLTRSIHNIEIPPSVRSLTGFDELEGTLGIGCISIDNEPQPLLIQSHHLQSFAITTVVKSTTRRSWWHQPYENGHIHFMEMSHGRINATELVAALINQKSTLVEGLFMPRKNRGSMSTADSGRNLCVQRYRKDPLSSGTRMMPTAPLKAAYINLDIRTTKLGPAESNR